MTKVKKGTGILKSVPVPLLKALVNGNVVPFVGAGFSKNCDGPADFEMPDWKALGRAVAEEIADYEYDDNPIEALSVYDAQYKRPSLVEVLRNILNVTKIRPGEAHHLLVKCFKSIICTTNFDCLLEMALAESGIGHAVVTSEAGLSTLVDDGVTLIKAHGDLNHPDRMVVTEGDYDLFVSKNPLLCTFISSLFITKTLLLVGYSLEDNDLRQLLHIVQDRLGKMARPIYSIQVSATPAVVARFKRRGVDVINLSQPKGKTYKETITGFLQQLSSYIDEESQKHVSSNEEDSKEQLLLSSSDNKLCFVSCPQSRIAFLKKILNPVIRESGAVPFWTDEVIAKDGMHYRNAIEAAINRSSVKIVDISEKDKVPASLLLSRDNYDERIILIEGNVQSRYKKVHVGGRDVLHYGIESTGEEDLFEANDGFLDAIRGRIISIYGKAEFSRAEIEMNSAERLFADGEYNAAVITAWVALEREIRKGNNCINPKDFISRLNKLSNGDENLRSKSIQLRKLRNYIVHGVEEARRKDAQFAIDVVAKLLSIQRKHERG